MRRNESDFLIHYGVLQYCLFILLWFVLVFWRVDCVSAQGKITWNEPFNVSMSGTSSSYPAIVADAYGYVHVFWSEDMDGPTISTDELPRSGNTILYRCWDGRSWTESVDILAVSNESYANFIAVAVDDMNQLHLVWSGSDNLYYSTAFAADAYSARAWSPPQVFSGQSADTLYGLDVDVDSQGKVHIVYAEKGNDAGVLYVSVPTDNAAWSLPVGISDGLGPNEVAFAEVRLAIDTSDRLHVAWGTANRNDYVTARWRWL